MGGHDLKKRERHDMGIWSREENAGETENQKRDIDMGKYSHHLGKRILLVAVLHARCSGGLCVGSGDHGLGVGFVEDTLDDLLLFGAEHLGQALVKLGLLLLEV